MKLRPLITQYISYRKSLGAKFRGSEYTLKAFCKAMGDDVEITEVEVGRVQTFLAGARPITSTWQSKYSVLTGFYKYAISRGYVASAPLPTEKPRLPEPFVPYIYSREELCRILEASNAKRPPNAQLEPHALRALLLLLYGAGMRLSEALSLTLADVDLPGARIVIRETKFYKTRLVPLGTQLQQVLVCYETTRRAAGHAQDQSARFFVTRRGKPVRALAVERVFRRLCTEAGVNRNDGARYQPRLHDLRHTFAVDRLTTWYRAGADVQKLLPQLATYLGHINISSTQRYLTMTPELLQEASVCFAKYAFQEVRHD
jgi:site-specific recombinase XerD